MRYLRAMQFFVALALTFVGADVAFAICGDGTRQAGENCDDGNTLDFDGCDALCQLEYCGDGTRNNAPLEACDDGNQRSGDGCDHNCEVEIEYSCTGAQGELSSCVRTSICGNGTVDPGEECDDSNLVNNDGCSDTCRVESCGDGIVQASEACDMFQLTGTHPGCLADCTVGSGYSCANEPGLPSVCREVCGDGVPTPREGCDDGNLVDGDGCSSNCSVEACGNGFIDAGEACDDGNTVAGDGCAADCLSVEAGFECGAFCMPTTSCTPGNLAKYIGTSGVTNSTYIGSDVANPYRIFSYYNIAAFNLTGGEILSFDSMSVETVPLRARIWMASSDSLNNRTSPWTLVVDDYTMPHNGDTKLRNFDLRFPVTGAYSHPGGYMLMRWEIIEGGHTVRPGLSSYFKGSWKDADGVEDSMLPSPGWDSQMSSSYALEFVIRTGPTPCFDYEAVGGCGGNQKATCDPATLTCKPPSAELCSDATRNCGCGSGTCSDCESQTRWNLFNYFDCVDGVYFTYQRLAYYEYSCYESTTSRYCSTNTTSGGSFTTYTLPSFDFVGCRDGDICTQDTCSTTSCVNSEVPAVACYDGPTATQGVGACADGLEYCRDPGVCAGQVLPAAEVCDGIDNDCNTVTDDDPDSSLTCDDGNAATADSCASGTCQNVLICTQSDTDCGTTTTCENCNLQDGWYNVGAPYACCSGGGQSCDCQDEEYRDYYCNSGTCFAVVTATNVQQTGCATCDDANLCTDDFCNAGTGVCDVTNNTFSQTCYTGPTGTEGVGPCVAGTETCAGGVMGACTDVTPTTETCDGIDNDCNDLVDDGLADNDCPLGQACHAGACFEQCVDSPDCPAQTCFDDSFVCLDDEPCNSVTCPGANICYEGSCYPGCNSDIDCTQADTRCYQSQRCLQAGQKCRNVQCPVGQTCREGGCYEPCSITADCSDINAECYDGFCMTTPCGGIDCLMDEVCWQANCFESCLVDDDCSDPSHACWDATRCAPADDPCSNVICPEGEFCYGGSCFVDCTQNVDCTDPGHACYDAARCATDACDGVQCPTGTGCFGGNCFDLCASDVDCTDPGDICFENFCMTDACESVQCPEGMSCYLGGCFDPCASNEDCTDPTHECYNGLCASDPCTGTLCPVGESCWGGYCFADCDLNPDCSTVSMTALCWNEDRCADDVCANVACPVDDVCYGGACFETCGDTADCSDPTHACYDGRCTSEACLGVQCPQGDICYAGTCFESCAGGAVCTDPTHSCFDERCALDECEGVQCPTDNVCYGGACFESCGSTIDCSDPSHVCFDSRCEDPCAGITCGGGEVCYAGTCYETCNVDADCSDRDSICFDERCVSPEDPACDGVNCPTGEACYGGTCYESCGTDADCSDPNSICYGDVCLATDCGSTRCRAGEVCFGGACFAECGDDADCSDPAHACYDGRCANSACEAIATDLITDYNANHPFKNLGHRLNASQLSSPAVWPRPYTQPGTSFDDWVQLPNAASVSATRDVLQKSKARVVFFLDEANKKYYIWLAHGDDDPSQGYVEVTYSIRFLNEDPRVVLMDDRDREGYTIAPKHNNETQVQVFINSVAGTTGGIAFEMPADKPWQAEINSQFSGDIVDWEVMNGERNKPIKVARRDETLTIGVVPLEYNSFDPASGFECDTYRPGICGRGSLHQCTNWQMRCFNSVNAAAFEVCDGVDNTCDGRVDALGDLRVPMLYTRQWDVQRWRVWPTFDSNQTINDWVRRRTRSGDNRLGYTDARQIDGTSFQRVRQVNLAAHRHLPTGQISTPIFIGAYSDDDDDEDDFGGKDVKMGVRALGTTPLERSFVAWYDDRPPASTSDKVLKRFETANGRYDADFKIEKFGNDRIESDTWAPRPLWNAYFLNPVEYRIVYTDLIWRYAWRRVQPGLPKSDLNRAAGLQVRTESAPIDEAFCISDQVTENGCRIGVYICTANGIQCSPPDDAICSRGCADNDGDGYDDFDPVFCPDGTDCDDDDRFTYPGAPEICNGRDNSCDGEPDQTTSGCPAGQASCGPEECGFRNVCVCPEGPELPGDPVSKCFCGEGLQ